MLKKLWCLIWGHKFIQKSYTGNTVEIANALTGPEIIAMYQWHVNEYCPRCGVKNPHKESK